MSPKNIVIGQRVTSEKAARARELRREMTEEERILWQRLRKNRLEGWHFRRQQVVAGFIVDFYCHAAALVIELDGAVHASQAEADAERDQVLGDLGLRVLRFQNRQVNENLEDVLNTIFQACKSSSLT